MGFGRKLVASANGKDMSLVQGTTYHAAVSWGVFKEDQSWWDLARADRAGKGTANFKKWYIAPVLIVGSSLSGVKLLVGSLVMVLAAVSLF